MISSIKNSLIRLHVSFEIKPAESKVAMLTLNLVVTRSQGYKNTASRASFFPRRIDNVRIRNVGELAALG